MTDAQDSTRQQKMQWNAAASAWERQDDWLDARTRVVTEWLCDAAGLQPGLQVLDLACGTGQPAAEAAVRVRPGGRVVATDLAPDMVAATRRKVQRLGLDNVEAREMDMQALALPDASFDAATCRFGLMFAPDPVRAAAEVRRVLRPGARFALSVWDEPAANPFFTVLARAVADFVPMPPPDPSAPGVFRLAPPGELERVLAAAGFHDIVVERRPLTFTFASPEEYWAIQSELTTPLRAAMATLDPPALGRLKTAVLAAVARHVVDDAVRFAAVPLCARASR